MRVKALSVTVAAKDPLEGSLGAFGATAALMPGILQLTRKRVNYLARPLINQGWES